MIDDSFDKSDSGLDNFLNKIVSLTQELGLSLGNVEGQGAQYLVHHEVVRSIHQKNSWKKEKDSRSTRLSFCQHPALQVSENIYTRILMEIANDQFL